MGTEPCAVQLDQRVLIDMLLLGAKNIVLQKSRA
jgi:hypothetical protein